MELGEIFQGELQDAVLEGGQISPNDAKHTGAQSGAGADAWPTIDFTAFSSHPQQTLLYIVFK